MAVAAVAAGMGLLLAAALEVLEVAVLVVVVVLLREQMVLLGLQILAALVAVVLVMEG
jgi:hypothetical protein